MKCIWLSLFFTLAWAGDTQPETLTGVLGLQRQFSPDGQTGTVRMKRNTHLLSPQMIMPSPQMDVQRTVSYRVDDVGGQFHFETRGGGGHVHGCYGQRSDGRETFYIADENGYRTLDRRKALLDPNSGLFPGECFQNSPEPLIDTQRVFNQQMNPLKLTSMDPEPISSKLIMTKDPNTDEEVPVMVVLVPFCPNQHKVQFPPLKGVIPARASAFRLSNNDKK